MKAAEDAEDAEENEKKANGRKDRMGFCGYFLQILRVPGVLRGFHSPVSLLFVEEACDGRVCGVCEVKQERPDENRRGRGGR